MPYFEVDQSVIDSMEPEAKAKFVAYEPEDVTGLKSKANELLSEVKTLKANSAQLEADLKAAKLNKDGGGDEQITELKSLLESSEAKRVEAENGLTELQSTVKNKEKGARAFEIASELTKDTRRAKLLAEKISSRIDVADGKETVLDESGNPTVSTIDELKGVMKKEFDFLVDGSSASGGGQHNPGGGAQGQNNSKHGEALSQYRAKLPGLADLPVN